MFQFVGLVGSLVFYLTMAVFKLLKPKLPTAIFANFSFSFWFASFLILVDFFSISLIVFSNSSLKSTNFLTILYF